MTIEGKKCIKDGRPAAKKLGAMYVCAKCLKRCEAEQHLPYMQRAYYRSLVRIDTELRCKDGSRPI